MRCDWTQPEVNARFDLLAGLLATHHLPTQDGAYRQAQAGEFMLMHEDENGTHFKHRDTRNYLTVPPTANALVVPVGGAFCRGFFDIVQFETEDWG